MSDEVTKDILDLEGDVTITVSKKEFVWIVAASMIPVAIKANYPYKKSLIQQSNFAFNRLGSKVAESLMEKLAAKGKEIDPLVRALTDKQINEILAMREEILNSKTAFVADTSNSMVS